MRPGGHPTRLTVPHGCRRSLTFGQARSRNAGGPGGTEKALHHRRLFGSFTRRPSDSTFPADRGWGGQTWPEHSTNGDEPSAPVQFQVGDPSKRDEHRGYDFPGLIGHTAGWSQCGLSGRLPTGGRIHLGGHPSVGFTAAELDDQQSDVILSFITDQRGEEVVDELIR